ncbi:long-chain acyl-CoA synthetase [Motilibacter peucedani]|uniref:Long-chain acyl-CoA synthetase n=1 Tax=Motilibacter peucedani TaxID=598650 RepID=A0A420XRX2_9ACTN|nr:long-chain-fatty-acid--CoA ligase [Motilibacter peucedani]RKS77547.1 long-chain acyl-CoA synthetase [Motilibacter peucedani]
MTTTTGSTDRRWLAAYAEGVPADVDVPEAHLGHLLERAVAQFPDSPALDFYGSVTTYAELGRRVSAAAGALRSLGVGRGDRVAIVLPNCPTHVVVFWAVLRLGAVVVENNPLYTAEELVRQLADSGAEVVLAWEKSVATVRAVQPRTSVRTVVAVDLSADLPRAKRLALRLPVAAARTTRAALRAPVPRDVPRLGTLLTRARPVGEEVPLPAPDDLALLQYTGGTTGEPKGAMLTHRNLLANAEQSAAWVPGLRQGAETFAGVLPVFHAYGLTLCLTAATRLAACVVLFPRFDLDAFLQAMRRRPVTFLPGVPGMYDRLARASETTSADLSSIRFSLSGAMALPPVTVDAWEKVTGGLLVEGYGMTETSPITVGNPLSDRRRPGTVGVPFPSTEVRIVDPAAVAAGVDPGPLPERPLGEAGELLVRGPQVFAGYWKRPEDTAATLLPGGWIRTGDIAVMDDDGFVSIVDRIKELIITGGFNVYPSEVEDVLKTHPSLTDAAVVGLPVEHGGEEVVAAVVARERGNLDEETLRAWTRERLSGFKVPHRFVVVEEIPRNPIGKTLRREVRAELLRRAEEQR